MYSLLSKQSSSEKFLSSPVPIDGTPRRDLVSAQRADAALPDYTRRASGAGYPRGPSSSGIELDSAHRRECSHGQLPLHRVGRRRSKRWPTHRFFSLKTVRITCRGVWTILDTSDSLN